MKKWRNIIGLVMIGLLLISCQGTKPYQAYEEVYLDAFDTVIKVIIHEQSEQKAQEYFEFIHHRLVELDDYFNTFNPPKEGNNIYTVNEKAGVEPVKLPKETIDLLLFCKNCYETYSHKTDITIGPVTWLWHEHRQGHVMGDDVVDEEEAIYNEPTLPSDEALRAAAEHMGMEHLIIDKEAMTAYLDDPEARLDVGAVGKGYAVEVVAQEVMDMGLESGIISAGGNVRTMGEALAKDRKSWAVGIENPDVVARNMGNTLSDILYVDEGAIVTSGDYQRYYIVDGKAYHHLIDPDTLYPGNYCRSVTIFCPNSGLADFLSTSCFLLPLEEGKELIESIPDAEAFWVFEQGKTAHTSGMTPYLQSEGATPR